MPNDTERAPHRRPIANNAHTDWLKKLAEIPALPTTGEGEWYHTVESGWMHGISVNDRPQDSNTHLTLTRAANNESRFGKPVLSYDVFFQWGAGRDYGNMTLDPEAAIYFGQHLIEAGSAALHDQARHATWMVGTPSAVAVEVPDKVRTPAESLPLVDPGTGRHEVLATVRSGDVSLIPERFDYRPDDGTAPTAEWTLRALTPSLETLREFLDGDDLQGMRQQAADLIAALTRAMEIFDDEAEKLTRAEV